MLKFGTPTIALPLAIKKCTVQAGCTVHVLHIISVEDFWYFYKRNEVQFAKKLMKDIFHSIPLQISARWANLHLFS